MAWSWSHSPEAYSNAYHNLHQQPHSWLLDAFSEFKATTPYGLLNTDKFKTYKITHNHLPPMS